MTVVTVNLIVPPIVEQKGPGLSITTLTGEGWIKVTVMELLLADGFVRQGELEVRVTETVSLFESWGLGE
jgi:hypothetical protein